MLNKKKNEFELSNSILIYSKKKTHLFCHPYTYFISSYFILNYVEINFNCEPVIRTLDLTGLLSVLALKKKKIFKNTYQLCSFLVLKAKKKQKMKIYTLIKVLLCSPCDKIILIE